MAKSELNTKMLYLERNRDREFPSQHQYMLNNIIGQKEHEQLPAVIVNEYWRWKEMSDRVSLAMTPAMLVCVVGMSGFDHAAPAGLNVATAFKGGIVKKMGNIEVLSRDEWKSAQIVDVNERDRTARVVVAGDGVAKSVPLAHCRLKDYYKRSSEARHDAEHATSNV